MEQGHKERDADHHQPQGGVDPGMDDNTLLKPHTDECSTNASDSDGEASGPIDSEDEPIFNLLDDFEILTSSSECTSKVYLQNIQYHLI